MWPWCRPDGIKVTAGVRQVQAALAASVLGVGQNASATVCTAVSTRWAVSRKAHRIAKSLRAGMVYVNCYDADDITVPFGGFKQSGTGRDKSLHAFDKYTELKTTWIDLSQ